MNRNVVFLALGLALASTSAYAEPWSYRGSLSTHGRAAEGVYDLRLSFHEQAVGGRELRAPVTLSAVAVRGGEFAADVELDPALLAYDTLWVGLQVRDGAGEFVAIPQRQRFEPDGGELTCWDTFGNTGTNGATNFLGTIDAQPLTLRAGNRTALTIAPADFGHVNAIGGGTVSPNNTPRVTAGVSGAVIAGGGAPSGPFTGFGGGDFHVVSDDDGVVGGGFGNKAGDLDAVVDDAAWATVGGGLFNNAGGETSVVSGGSSNGATGKSSTVPGGFLNAAGGEFSLAAGRRAKVRTAAASGDANGDEGTFVWADTIDSDYTSTGPNQFLVRASGGAGINVTPAQMNNPGPRAGLLVNSLTAAGPAVIFNPATGATLTTSQGGSIELGAGDNVAAPLGSTPFIDFHLGNGQAQDANVRLINFTDGALTLFGNFEVTNNAFKPGGGAWGVLSDSRLKQNVRAIDSPLARLLALEGHEFEYIAGKHAEAAPGTQRGFIAQEVEALFPEWIETDAEGYKSVSIRGFEALTVEAIRDLKAQHDVELVDLRSENAELRERLDALELRVSTQRR